LDTGFFALAVGAVMPPYIRCLQTLTAAAVVFAILGACGLPPPRRGPRPLPRPRRPVGEVTIRSLTGTWDAARPAADDRPVLTLSLVQHGDTLEGSLRTGGRTLASDASWPAHLDAGGRFVLVFGQAPETIVVRGRPDPSGDRIPVTVTGLGPEPMATVLRRR
jgi:hypothetical protein